MTCPATHATHLGHQDLALIGKTSLRAGTFALSKESELMLAEQRH